MNGYLGAKDSESVEAMDEAVMTAQKDLVEVVHTLKQVVCVKG